MDQVEILLLIATAFVLSITTAAVTWILVSHQSKRISKIAAYAQSLRAYIVPRVDVIEDALLGVRILTTDAPEPPAELVPDEVPQEKPLSTRERNTLLTIIAVLCKDAGYDVSKNAKTAGLICNSAAEMGLSIGETTIEGHLKRVPEAIASRMK